MPLSEAFGTSVDRISGESVKNSTPPERTWLSMSVSEPSWLFGKIWMTTRPVGFLLDLLRRLVGAHVHRMRDRQVVGVFVGELGRLRASAEEAADRGGRGGDLKQDPT